MRGPRSPSPRVRRGRGEGASDELRFIGNTQPSGEAPSNPSFSPHAGRRWSERRAVYRMPCANYAIAPAKERKPSWRRNQSAGGVRGRLLPGYSGAGRRHRQGLHLSASCCSARRCRGAGSSRTTSITSATVPLCARPWGSPRGRAGRGLCQRRLRPRLRVRQSAAAVDRRASRRHRVDRCFSCSRRSPCVRQGFDHRLHTRPGMHVPERAEKSSEKAWYSTRPASPACSDRRSRPAGS